MRCKDHQLFTKQSYRLSTLRLFSQHPDSTKGALIQMTIEITRSQIATAVAAVLSMATMAAASAKDHGNSGSDVGPRSKGQYETGDFHNHTTCSDGSISMQKLIKKVTDKQETPWGLDWFVQAGHGGNGNRNCTLVEDA